MLCVRVHVITMIQHKLCSKYRRRKTRRKRLREKEKVRSEKKNDLVGDVGRGGGGGGHNRQTIGIV